MRTLKKSEMKVRGGLAVIGPIEEGPIKGGPPKGGPIGPGPIEECDRLEDGCGGHGGPKGGAIARLFAGNNNGFGDGGDGDPYGHTVGGGGANRGQDDGGKR